MDMARITKGTKVGAVQLLNIMRRLPLYVTFLLVILPLEGISFVLRPPTTTFVPCRRSSPCSERRLSTLPEMESMRAGEIKKELESYGISTKSFLEKSELVDALKKARADGLQPKAAAAPNEPPQPFSTTSSSQSYEPPSGSTSTAASSSTKSTTINTDSASKKSRDERIADEIEKCKSMKASELKRELMERGVSTASFLEKFEFVRALAKARVDGVTTKSSQSSSSSNESEGYAEYKNVEVLTDDAAGPRKKQSQQQQQQQQQQQPRSPFGGGGNPFAGGGNPFGGATGGNPFGGAAGGNPFEAMGGMGGFADILKNMGGMGGGFGGTKGGKNPFDMGKAQDLMKNPKVRELMQRAQANPRLMTKVNECMSNPASFAKYQNDPDVAELVKELRKYM